MHLVVIPIGRRISSVVKGALLASFPDSIQRVWE